MSSKFEKFVIDNSLDVRPLSKVKLAQAEAAWVMMSSVVDDVAVQLSAIKQWIADNAGRAPRSAWENEIAIMASDNESLAATLASREGELFVGVKHGAYEVKRLVVVRTDRDGTRTIQITKSSISDVSAPASPGMIWVSRKDGNSAESKAEYINRHMPGVLNSPYLHQSTRSYDLVELLKEDCKGKTATERLALAVALKPSAAAVDGTEGTEAAAETAAAETTAAK